MLHLYLQQLADAGSSGRHEPHHEVPFHSSVLSHPTLEVLVVFIADDILQKTLLLHFYSLQLQVAFPSELQILIQCVDLDIDRCWLVMGNTIFLIAQQVGIADRFVEEMESFYCR